MSVVMCWDQWIDVLMVAGTWLAGIGTLLAVVVVLNLDHWRRPRLDLDPIPDIRHDIRIMPDQIPGATFIRFKIRNRTKYLARKVMVKVNEVMPASGVHTDETREIDTYRPEIVGGLPFVDIYPFDESNMFDLVWATDAGNRKTDLVLCLSRVAETSPRAITREQLRDDYIFTVTLYGDNIDTMVTKIRVLAKGKKANEITAEIL